MGGEGNDDEGGVMIDGGGTTTDDDDQSLLRLGLPTLPFRTVPPVVFVFNNLCQSCSHTNLPDNM